MEIKNSTLKKGKNEKEKKKKRKKNRFCETVMARKEWKIMSTERRKKKKLKANKKETKNEKKN